MGTTSIPKRHFWIFTSFWTSARLGDDLTRGINRYTGKDNAVHRLAAIASSALLAIPVMLALGSGTALADGSAPAPSCDNSTAHFWLCSPTAGSAPFTWTITEHIPNFGNVTHTSTKTNVSGSCAAGDTFVVSYSYVSNGVTFDSGSTFFPCNTTSQ